MVKFFIFLKAGRMFILYGHDAVVVVPLAMALVTLRSPPAEVPVLILACVFKFTSTTPF